MNIIKRIYRFLFERGCVDYTQPFVVDYEDSGFDKWNIPQKSKETPYYTYKTNQFGDVYREYRDGRTESTNHYPSTQWSYGTISWPGTSNIGYHNSRL